MKIDYLPRALKALKDAPATVRKAFYKQVEFLEHNLQHPSLHAKKYVTATGVSISTSSGRHTSYAISFRIQRNSSMNPSCSEVQLTGRPINNPMPLVFPVLRILQKLWGGPPGPRGSPRTRFFALVSTSSKREGRPGGRPRTRGSAPQFWRPTGHRKNEWHWINNRPQDAILPHNCSESLCFDRKRKLIREIPAAAPAICEVIRGELIA